MAGFVCGVLFVVQALTTWRQLHFCGIASAIGEHADSLFRIAMRVHQNLLRSVGAETGTFSGIQLFAVGISNIVDDAPNQRGWIGNNVGCAVGSVSARNKNQTVSGENRVEDEPRTGTTIRCLHTLFIHVRTVGEVEHR